MNVLNIFVRLLLIYSTECYAYKFSLTTYTSKDPVELVLWDSFEEELFVAGRNQLMKLDTNLKVLQDASTGPVQDNTHCPPLPAPCRLPRREMDNYAKVLLDYSEKVLLMCGTANQGMCSLYKKSDIIKFKRTVGSVEDFTNFVAGRDTVVAFMGLDYSEQKSLYSAITYDGRPREFIPYSISSRFLPSGSRDLNYSYKSNISITALDFHGSFKDNIQFIYGFSYEGFSYFLSTQLLHHDTFETRLGRVCQNDVKFASYSEIPLRCMKKPVNFNLAMVAYLADTRTDDQKFEADETMMSLFVVFGSSPIGSQVRHELGSVLCVFPMSEIEEYFWNATRYCMNGKRGSYLLKNIHGYEEKCARTFQIGDDYVKRALCDPGLNAHILGPEKVTGSLRANVTDIVTSLAVTMQNDTAVGFLGTSTGNILKFTLDEKEYNTPLYNITLFENQNMPEPRVRRSVAFDDNEDNLFLLADNMVVKFPAKSCTPYTDCVACLTRADPLGCGWCGDRCASQSECNKSWEKFVCPPLIFSVNPRRAHVNGGTLITIIGDNFGSQASGVKARITVEVNGVICEIICWEFKSIQCRTQRQPEAVSSPVVLSVKDFSYEHGHIDINGTVLSNDHIAFLNPEFFGISPWFGPISGGTNVTIVGENLDIGSSLEVSLSGIKCKVYHNNGSHVLCTSGRRTTNNYTIEDGDEPGNVLVRIDGNVMITTLSDCTYCSEYRDHFQYRLDPIVDNVWPQVASFTLETNLTVNGSHLDCVSRPRMIVTVISNPLTGTKQDIIQDCYHGDMYGTTLYCTTPSLENVMLYTTPTSQLPIITHMAFLMDGVQDTLQFSYLKKQFSQLVYYPDPIFYQFEGNLSKVSTDDYQIVIKGSNLNLALQKEMIFVFVGGSVVCRVSELSFQELRCSIVNRTQLPSELKKCFVTVRVGRRVFWVGHIVLVDPLQYFQSRVLTLVVLCIVFFIAVVLLVLYRRRLLNCKSRRKRTDGNFIVSYNANSPDRINGNDYLESPGVTNNQAPPNYCSAQPLKAPKISEETIHLLEVENILFERIYLTLEEEIGQGHFGRVYKGEHRLPGKEELSRDVAVKTLHNCRYQDEESVESFLQEGLMMKDFHHHHVLTLIGVCFEDNGFPMVILPFMENGDLRSYIQDEKNEPTIKMLIDFGIQIAEGMQYLSELKFIHRDLAARNCMLDSDLTVKVADFGLSRDVYEREYYSSDNKSKLPVKWMAPESLEKGTYSTKTDVWSYGVVLWELLTRGVTPYPEVGNWEILQYIREGRRMLQPSFCPDTLYRIMLRCWNEDPRKRPTFLDLTLETKELMSTMESNHRQRTVGLSVTYVNIPTAKKRSNYNDVTT